MKNPYLPTLAVIRNIRAENSETRTYSLQFKDKTLRQDFHFRPGQIVELSLPGFGEAPFGLASAPGNRQNFDITVRAVGRLTRQLARMRKGQVVGVRGPLGLGTFPLDRLKERNALLVAGGTGIVPMRALIQMKLEKPESFGDIQVFYGARAGADFLYRTEFCDWSRQVKLCLAVEKNDFKPKDGRYSLDEGVVTVLFQKAKPVKDPIVIITGPPVMARFVLKELKGLRIPESDIYISLERRMECGVGVCQHCAVGPYYVCKDGPVFPYEKIKNIPDII